MVNNLPLLGKGRPRLRCQPKAAPESSLKQLASQPTPALAEDADFPRGYPRGMRRWSKQSARRQTPMSGIFGPGAISQHPQGSHRQHQPVASYPVWVGALGVLPLPAHPLQGSKSQFNPDPQAIPGYPQVLWGQVGQYQPRLSLLLNYLDPLKRCRRSWSGFVQ